MVKAIKNSKTKKASELVVGDYVFFPSKLGKPYLSKVQEKFENKNGVVRLCLSGDWHNVFHDSTFLMGGFVTCKKRSLQE